MGRGDNRKSAKMRRRKSWRRHKARVQKKIEEGKANKGNRPAKAPAATASSPQTIKREGE